MGKMRIREEEEHKRRVTKGSRRDRSKGKMSIWKKIRMRMRAKKRE